ncbi:Oidioi.mRNA.OKI2018_I69.chr2.g5187.t1.cds [Oikopleura dioica]|uniref:Oidioi.mRNA.OKI2018_I69.chr2.g5187.t1.cds n=1 Tax=Oikopleura dioica TaxID=34765 RepID=A0ABN7T1A8_OIKDI|nr:Oidioi.mRNA.OKI2018_I69.chr2.g5187.t1.cds [Oikopleura dioica]
MRFLKLFLLFEKSAFVNAYVNPYPRSPCFTDDHVCNRREEDCIPEGQFLYQCCTWGKYMSSQYREEVSCRVGNPHPCMGENACQEDEFCHPIIKNLEVSSDYECVEIDDKCHGYVHCENVLYGSCTGYIDGTHMNTSKPLRVNSVDDCYNHCASYPECTGFDLDSNGGCYLAFQACEEDHLVINHDKDNHKWNTAFTTSAHYLHYRMSDCTAPKRPAHCDVKIEHELSKRLNEAKQQMKGRLNDFEILVDAQEEARIAITELRKDTSSHLINIVGIFAAILIVRSVMISLNCTIWKERNKKLAVGRRPHQPHDEFNYDNDTERILRNSIHSTKSKDSLPNYEAATAAKKAAEIAEAGAGIHAL